MDVVVATATAAALTGAAVGLAAGLAFRASERSRKPPAALPVEPTFSEGVERVLSVLRSSSVVLNEDRVVIHASPATYAFGIVKQGRLAVAEIDWAAEQVQRDGEIRDVEVEVSRSIRGEQPLHLFARVAPLSSRLVLVLVEDRTQAHRIDEIRRDFVANVSHELKTPIGAVSLLAEAVLGASDDPEAVRRFASRMQSETDRLARLVQEIVDLSRLQYDDPISSPEVVPLDDVVATALDRCRVDADAKHIRLTSGGDRGVHVVGKEQQLVMALGNLVENAVSYSPDHSQVSVAARRRRDTVEISVTDQGIGIPEPELDRIFERFYRGDPARSRATGGSGLGLSIVKHVAASHGGEVDVWSVPGTGSTFTLRLPLPPARQSGQGTIPPATAAHPMSPSNPIPEATA